MSKCLCLILLLLHQTSVSRPESLQVLGPADPIVAVAGEDIVLPCYLKPSISAEDMRVEWSRISSTGIIVHHYRDREIRNEDQIPSYRGRTALSPEELKRGNASLRLTGVRASDEGRYKCFIQSKLWYDDATVQVQIRGTEPVISMVPHRAGWVSLLCESKDWDIQPDLLWLDSEGHSLPAAATETHRDSEDLYTVRKRIIIQNRTTNTITCRVDLRQPKLRKDTVFNITAEMFPVPHWKASLAVFLPLAAAALIGCAVLTHRYKKLNRERDEFKRSQQALKNDLNKKFESIFGSLAQAGHPALLDEIYTDVYISEGGNTEHEVRQIKTASRRQATQETAILCKDIFEPLPGQEKSIRTVLTKGIASALPVQKFILDWAKGKANQDIHFIFTLPFRDLNLLIGKISLMKLLQHYFPQLKEIKSVERNALKVVFIFDGLDECQLPLDFQKNEICCDVTESKSVDVLLTNLIQGNLLPSALLWITSRPAAANQIPPEYVHQVTEARGFSEPQKEEYFRKRIRDQNLASRIISHIKSSSSLYFLCHIPLFCHISASALERMFGEANSEKFHKPVTEMYTNFLLLQINLKNQKYHWANEIIPRMTSNTEIILKLGKLAFAQLEMGRHKFSEEDLRESGIDVSEALVYSGVCTEIFKVEYRLNHEKVYSFVHLSIQEYLAALFVFLSCVNESRNVFRPEESRPQGDRMELSELHRSAVDQTLQSKNGHLDLFLRFHLGLSLDSNQTLLDGLLTQKRDSFKSIINTVKYIEQKASEEFSAERIISLFHCLNEIHSNSVVEEKIQTLLRRKGSGKHYDKKREPNQCSALAFTKLNSEEVLDEFDLKTFNTSAAGHQRMVPVIRNCRKAILNSGDLTKESFEIVTSVLQSSNSPLRELDLSYNKLGDPGVKLLCDGLKSPNCKLQTLMLGWCNLTERCCDDLASVLRSPHSELRDLELRDNDLQDSGVRALSAGLEDPHCKLERLGLSGCRITKRGCDSLASALRSSTSHLRDLDLSYNHLEDSGVRALSAAKLDTLKLLFDNGGECRNKPGPRKYGCQLTLDPNTANKKLSLSEGNRKVTQGKEKQPYPDLPQRFTNWVQVMCRESLSGRCYWEAEWSVSKDEVVYIAVTCKEISRTGLDTDCAFGQNRISWSLECSEQGYVVWHKKKKRETRVRPFPYCTAGGSMVDKKMGVYRVGVYVDSQSRTLSFYSIPDPDTLTPLYIFHMNITNRQTLCAGFHLDEDTWMSLCQLE